MRSIFGKTLLSHIIVVLVTLMTILVLFPTFFTRVMMQGRQAQLATLGSRIAEILSTEEYGTGTVLLRQLHRVSGTEIWVVDAQGRILTASVLNRINQLLSETSRQALMRDTTQIQRRFGDGFNWPMMVVSQPTGPIRLPSGTASHILLFTPMHEFSNVFEQTLRQLSLYALPIVLCVAFGMAWFMSRRLSQPLVAIKATVQEIAEGKLGAQVTHTPNDEIGLLAQGVNSMSAELARLFSVLSDEKKRTESILANMSEGVLSIDLEQEEALYNRETARVLDLPIDGATTLGRCRSTELLLNIRGKEVISLIEATIERKTIHQMKLQLHKNNTYLVTASPLIGEDGRIRGSIVLISDISQQHRFEESQREFFASISHDLRTPLTVLRSL